MSLPYKYSIFLSSLRIGNLYIADKVNAAIRKVTVTTNIITTIAGTGNGGDIGDGGQATSAELYDPNGVALDAQGRSSYCYLPLHVPNISSV